MLLWQKLCCFAVLLMVLAAHAAGDPKRGAQVFRQCMACHSVAAGEHMTGPSLAHIWNQKAGSVEGFLRYSNPMKRANLVWDEDNLRAFIKDPQGKVKGNRMPYGGLTDAADIEDVIAYLKMLNY